MLFTHNLDPVALDLGFWQIHWYGLAYVAAGIFTLVWLNYLQKQGKLKLTQPELADLEFWLFFGILVGGRVGYFLFYNFADFFSLAILRIWEGGMSFHGGLLGAILAILIFARRYRKTFLTLTDYLVFPITVGLILGRLANFINGELPGRVTGQNFGVVFPHFDAEPRHPSQLYAAAKNLGIASGIFWLQRQNPVPGVLSFCFLIFYSLLRIIMEIFWRAPLDGFILGLPRGAFFSIPVLLCGIGGLLWLKFVKKN